MEESKELKIIVPAGMTSLELAYVLKSKIEDIVREELINIIGLTNSKKVIPRIDERNGQYYSLCMLDMPYNLFCFKEMYYNDSTLFFYGEDEDGCERNIDEHELPDNGLLYLYDYLITGWY